MIQLAQLIKDACADTEQSDWEVNFRDSYSGRGMYGKQCIGIVGSSKNCMRVIADVIKAQATLVASEEVDEETRMDMSSEFDSMVDELMAFERDSMGYDVIIYWEGIQAPEEEEA